MAGIFFEDSLHSPLTCATFARSLKEGVTKGLPERWFSRLFFRHTGLAAINKSTFNNSTIFINEYAELPDGIRQCG